MGRTGKWWGHEHFAECSPDMLLFAKGIASGFPMAGVAATGEIYENLTAGMLVSMGWTSSVLSLKWYCPSRKRVAL